MADQIITEFDKNGTEKVRISLTEYKGKPLLDVRVFYQDRKTGEWEPSKGLSIRREQVGELKAGIDAALDAIEGRLN